jgi:hypothetical protein
MLARLNWVNLTPSAAPLLHRQLLSGPALEHLLPAQVRDALLDVGLGIELGRGHPGRLRDTVEVDGTPLPEHGRDGVFGSLARLACP